MGRCFYCSRCGVVSVDLSVVALVGAVVVVMVDSSVDSPLASREDSGRLRCERRMVEFGRLRHK